MNREEKIKLVLTDILNKQLEKYGLNIDSPEVRSDPEWYKNYNMTSQEYEVWKQYSINKLRTDLKFSKKRATLEFPWIDLMWGLNVKDEDGEE